jgi:hypothetical protein
MMKKIVWQPDSVISVQQRDDLYTLCQMRENHLMQFFDVRSADGRWERVDLNTGEPLFCISVAEQKFKGIFERWVDAADVQPSNREIPRLMLSAEILPLGDEGVRFHVRLIELDDDFESWSAKVVRSNITKDDLDLIYRHEMAGMHGSVEKLKKRLVRFFDTGVNWNDELSFIFPGVPLPPPKR